MGTEPKQDLQVDYTKTKRFRQLRNFVYRLATTQAEKSSSRCKAHYDKYVHGSTIGVGDHVLVQNVNIKGKTKLANLWSCLCYHRAAK